MNPNHFSLCRLHLAVLLVLAAIVDFSPALGYQAEGAEAVYASPHYGWSISWSAPWSPGSEEDRRSIQAELLLTNGTSLVAMTGFTSQASPVDCVDQMGGPLASEGLAIPEETGEAVDGARAWATYRSPDDGASIHAECRRIVPGQSLLTILHLVPALATLSDHDEERHARESLVRGLVLAEEPPSPVASPAPLSTIAEPGVIAGVVTDHAGRPISGVTIIVTEQDLATLCTFEQPFGTFQAPCSRSIGTVTDANGRYRFEPPVDPALEYAVDAYHDVTLGGEPYAFPLYPVDGDRSYQPAAEGIVEDFTWRISGRLPTMNGTHDPENEEEYPGDYYGGSLDVVDAFENVAPLAGQYPANAYIELVLEPRGPMIDGSQGETVRVQVDLLGEPLDGPDTYLGYVLDVPVGPYDVSADVILPDGEVEPLLVSVDCLNPETLEDFAESDELGFMPDPLYVPMALGGIETVSVCVAAR